MNQERQDEIEKEEEAPIEVFYGTAFFGVVMVVIFILSLFLYLWIRSE